jgi:MinD-like ATPase involved in chromosome partitioning or flagellar assembly
MSDDHPGSGAAEDDAEEQADRRRSSAQGAAAELARMGIDPTSLGLDAPPPPAVEERDDGQSADAPAAGFGTGWDLSAPPPRRPRHEGSPDADRDPDLDAGPGAGSGPRSGTESGAQVLAMRPEWGVVPAGTASRRTGGPGRADAGASASARTTRSRAVEEMLSRTSPPAPPRRRAPGLLGTFARGLLTPDAAEGVAGEHEVVAAVRTRQTQRRVVAFVAGKGGVGTTTVAAAVGTTLSALREDDTALVDLGTGTPALSSAFGAQPGPRARDLLRGDSSMVPTRSPAGLALVDASPWDAPLRRAETGPVLDVIGADHAFTLLDIGADPGEAGRAGLARADLVVVVTGTGDWGASATRTALQRLEDVDPFALDSVLHVVVSPTQPAHERLRVALAESVGTDVARTVILPPDESLASGRPYDPASVSPALRAAVLRLAAAISVFGGPQGGQR